MSTPNNPFVLPGLGQPGDLADNPMMASLEMMQQAWAGLAGPGGLAQAMPVPMSLEDLDRRIAELRTVENWLKLNQSMLSSTIQGMEVQRATIATLKTFVGTAPAAGDAPSPLEVVLGLKPAPTAAPAAGASAAQTAGAASDTAEATPAETPDSSRVGAAAAAAAQSATQAWWNLMQQQFGQLASATASSMAEAAAATAAASASPAEKTVAKTAAKTVAKTAAKKAPAKRTAPAKRAAPAKPRKKAV